MKKILPVLLGLVCLLLSLTPAAFAARQSGITIADLPPAARMAVSAALGRDNAAYHAVKIWGGYSFAPSETFQSSSMPKNSSDITRTTPPLDLRGGRVGLQESSKTVTSFNKEGAVVYGWRLSFAGIGRGGKIGVASSTAPVAKNNRIEYHRGDVTEWYINGPLGLEQGFTLRRAPEAGDTGPLTLAIKLPPNMKAEVAKSGTDVVLTGRKGAESLKYGNLVAWDATGRRLEAWFELSSGPARSPVPDRQSLSLYIRVNDNGARYPITVDPLIETQELTAGSYAAAGDYFGNSVSLSSDGNTALIGAPGQNSVTGAAYVFVRSGTTWSRQEELTAGPDAATGDNFGYSVSLSSDGNTALIGAWLKNSATGAAYVFVRSGTTWSQPEKLTASDAATGDFFGNSVSLNGDGSTALIGAWSKNSKTGAAYVFVWSGTTWSQKEELTAGSGAANDNYFGNSVSLSSDGGTALIGAVGKYSYTGAAYMFHNPISCGDGYYDNWTACEQCPAGTYQTAGYHYSCLKCPDGTSAAPGQASCTRYCDAGYYDNGSGCTQCTAGTYQFAGFNSSCISIPKAVTSIIVDLQTNPSTVYAGIDTEGVYKSTDNTNWTPANGTSPNTLTDLRVKALARSSAGMIYAATYGGGVFKTTDGGANWAACDTTNMTNLNVVSLAVDPSGKLYAGTEAGVFVSSDNCATWTAINNGLPN